MSASFGEEKLQKLVDYKAPPIVEVVAGVGFPAIEGFSIPHFGLFWKELPDDFENTQRGAPNFGGQNPYMDPKDFPVRCWYITKNGRRLVQLQQDFFAFNWRSATDDGPGDYPDFAKIYPEFEAYLTKLSNFTEENSLGPVNVNSCELTYVNIIPISSLGTRLQPAGNVLRDHCYDGENRFLEPPEEFDWRSVYPLKDGLGQLQIRGNTARLSADKSTKVIRLELSVQGRPEKSTEVKNWFLMARKQIVKAFEDVTDESVQRQVWGKK